MAKVLPYLGPVLTPEGGSGLFQDGEIDDAAGTSLVQNIDFTLLIRMHHGSSFFFAFMCFRFWLRIQFFCSLSTTNRITVLWMCKKKGMIASIREFFLAEEAPAPGATSIIHSMLST